MVYIDGKKLLACPVMYSLQQNTQTTSGYGGGSPGMHGKTQGHENTFSRLRTTMEPRSDCIHYGDMVTKPTLFRKRVFRNLCGNSEFNRTRT